MFNQSKHFRFLRKFVWNNPQLYHYMKYIWIWAFEIKHRVMHEYPHFKPCNQFPLHVLQTSSARCSLTKYFFLNKDNYSHLFIFCMWCLQKVARMCRLAWTINRIFIFELILELNMFVHLFFIILKL